VEVPVVLFFAYAAAIVAVLWHTLSYLPSAEVPREAAFILNTILCGFLSLLSFLTYRKETHFRSVFFQFWLVFAALALSAPTIRHFIHFGGPSDGVTAWILVVMATQSLVAWSIARIVLSYLLHEKRPGFTWLLPSLVVLTLSLWLFWPFWWNPQAILALPTANDAATLYLPVQKPLIVVNIVSLLMLLAFFLHKLRTDKPFGAFADTMLFLFGLFVAFDTVEWVTRVSSLELMNLSQWVNGVILSAMIVTLILRLRYKKQSIAHYYESQCLSGDPRVGRRIGRFDRLILWCFFNPKKIGKQVYLGPGQQGMTIKRTSLPTTRPSGRRA